MKVSKKYIVYLVFNKEALLLTLCYVCSDDHEAIYRTTRTHLGHVAVESEEVEGEARAR